MIVLFFLMIGATMMIAPAMVIQVCVFLLMMTCFESSGSSKDITDGSLMFPYDYDEEYL